MMTEIVTKIMFCIERHQQESFFNDMLQSHDSIAFGYDTLNDVRFVSILRKQDTACKLLYAASCFINKIVLKFISEGSCNLAWRDWCNTVIVVHQIVICIEYIRKPALQRELFDSIPCSNVNSGKAF